MSFGFYLKAVHNNYIAHELCVCGNASSSVASQRKMQQFISPRTHCHVCPFPPPTHFQQNIIKNKLQKKKKHILFTVSRCARPDFAATFTQSTDSVLENQFPLKAVIPADVGKRLFLAPVSATRRGLVVELHLHSSQSGHFTWTSPLR